MAYRGILFDLDGTLLDTLHDLAGSVNLALARNDLPTHSVAAYRYFVGDGVAKLIQRAVGERQDAFDRVMVDYRAIYARDREKTTQPYPGIEAMLHELIGLGLKICVFSNKPDSDTQAVIRHYFPSIPFAGVRGQLPGVPVKPDPAGAIALMESLGLTPEEMLYAGDTGVDMDCARNAGICSIGVTWGFRPREELLAHGACHLADTPAEVAALAHQR